MLDLGTSGHFTRNKTNRSGIAVHSELRSFPIEPIRFECFSSNFFYFFKFLLFHSYQLIVLFPQILLNSRISSMIIQVYAAEHDHDHDDDDDDDDDDHEMIGCCVIGISDEWLPENIEASIPIKLKLKSEEDKSGVNGKGIAWVVLGFGFFWKIFQ